MLWHIYSIEVSKTPRLVVKNILQKVSKTDTENERTSLRWKGCGNRSLMKKKKRVTWMIEASEKTTYRVPANGGVPIWFLFLSLTVVSYLCYFNTHQSQKKELQYLLCIWNDKITTTHKFLPPDYGWLHNERYPPGTPLSEFWNHSPSSL
jgi:hypothetical protein